MSKKTTLAVRIQSMLTLRGMTQSDLIKKGGIPQPTLSRIQDGSVKDPQGSTYVKISKGLDCDLMWLITGEQNEKGAK